MPKASKGTLVCEKLNKKELYLGLRSPKERNRRSTREQRVLAFYAEQQGGKTTHCGLTDAARENRERLYSMPGSKEENPALRINLLSVNEHFQGRV